MYGPQAFWSYARQDDKDEGGRITGLADLLSKRLRFRSGLPFPIFVDKSSLDWGDDWEQRIQEALLATTFFIPVITPSYFASESCRAELLLFSANASALGLEELILAIYYCDVPALEAARFNDEVIQLVRRYQYQDWRELALESEDSSRHRRAVDGLARSILDRAARADAKPADLTVVHERPRPVTDTAAEQPFAYSVAATEDEGDRLAILARGQEAVGALAEGLKQLGPILIEMGNDATAAANQMRVSDSQGKGFPGRLSVARAFAQTLSARADDVEPIVGQIVEHIQQVDAMVTTFFLILREDPAQLDEARPFLESLVTLADAVEAPLRGFQQVGADVAESGKWSKDIRGPAKRIEGSLLHLADASSVFRRWRAQAQRLLGTS